MSMFASKTPRENNDPTPWVRKHRDLGPMGRFASTFNGPAGYSFTHAPRKEYDHPRYNAPNRILEAFRLIDAGRNEYADWLRDLHENPQFWLREGRYSQYTQPELDHARKVLTRLARLTDKENNA